MKGRWETRTDTDDAMLSRRLRSLQVAYAACGDDYCRRYCNPNGRRPRLRVRRGSVRRIQIVQCLLTGVPGTRHVSHESV